MRSLFTGRYDCVIKREKDTTELNKAQRLKECSEEACCSSAWAIRESKIGRDSA